MSEAADAERAVEDFFNEEIFGAKPEADKEAPFPVEAPPEPKPVAEVAVDTPPEPEDPEEGTEEGTEETPDSEEVAPEQGEVEPEEGTAEASEEEYLTWAKKQYGDDLDPDKLARAAWEKEKLLGQKSESEKRLQKEAQDREIEQRLEFLNTPGVLTDEEDAWIDEAVTSADPAAAADALLTEGRADLYGAFIGRWLQQGDAEARQALQHRDRVMQWVSTPQPTEQESYTAALGQTFVSLGLDIETMGPKILQKAEELGVNHPSVQGMMSQDPDVRRIATRSVYDLATQGTTVVQKAKQDDVVAQRVQEEQLRQGAAAISNGGARPVEQKKGGFWDEFDKEIEERGWDGKRPSYGRGE